MEFTLEEWLLGAGVLLLLSVVASRVSDKLGIPALLLFLAIGMLAGSDGPGGIYFDDAHLAQGIGSGLLLAFFLVVIARPIGVFIVLGLTRFNWREKALVSWVGLRGAVPIILATFPLLAGIPQAESLFNLVFFIVLTSALLQGPLISQVALAQARGHSRAGLSLPARVRASD